MTDQTELADDAERFKRDYLRACKTIADMHAAATGYDDSGPERGVVEDVEDVRLRAERAEAAIERVRTLHRRNEHTGDCEHCSARDYPDYSVRHPCATVRALDEFGPAATEATEHQALRAALNSVYRTIVHDSRDWAATKRDAWLYAILVGWTCEDDHIHDDLCMGDEPLTETARRHGWDDDTVARLRSHRAAVAALGIDGSGQPVSTAETPIILPADQTTEK
ncbi:hypothetical protein ACFWMV_04695 [Streptomyces mutabilis]|uniref:hypothetical protein n=1 Tax=Streptomyces mutabilis TaxID=67332 RepID=UPI00365BDEA4